MRFPKNIAFCALAFAAGAWLASTYDDAQYSRYEITNARHQKIISDVATHALDDWFTLYSKCEMYLPEHQPWRNS